MRCAEPGCPETHLYLHHGRLYCLAHVPLGELCPYAAGEIIRRRCQVLRAALNKRRGGGPGRPPADH